MKTLHLTCHSGTRRNIENVFNYLNMNCDLVTESSVYGGFYIIKMKINYMNVNVFFLQILV